MDAASGIWWLIGEYTQELTVAYREAAAELLLAGAREHAALVEALFTGGIPDRDTPWEAAKLLRLPWDGVFVVVAVEAPGLAREGLPDAEALLAARGFGSAWRLQDKIALRIVQNALVTLDSVRVPEANRLRHATSFRDTAAVLRMTRAGVAWMAVGCARGAYEHALAYAVEREQFGRPIAGFQLVQDLLVKMLGNITASAALCARLSQLQAAGLASDEHASLAKAFCTTRMRETVGWARELLGGNGILLDHHVGRFVADAEAIYSYEGTREMNTLIVGRAITGHSAFV